MTRRVVVHQDDVGMCHGANTAFADLCGRGVITCGSVMVPCPWFAEVAAMAAASPHLDLGVHLTLTSEKAHYRWGPISGPPPAAGLTDASGMLWPDVASVRRHADPDAVEIELRAQVERAVAAGIDVTHLDAHMGAALAPEFCSTYVTLGVELGVPVLLTRSVVAYGPNNHLAGVTDDDLTPFVDTARQAGMPLFDGVGETPWDRPAGEPAAPAYEALVAALPDGLSFLALHPNAPGELEAIEPGTARIRIDEHALFGSERFRDWLGAQDLERMGMRTLRDEMRG